MKYLFVIFTFFLISCFQACDPVELIQSPEFKTEILADSITFAVIGDYGDGSSDELLVADMVKNWEPDFIITTGDNNYPDGDEDSMEDNIANFYGDFIYNYDASEYNRCNGKAFGDQINRFFPSPGNHDDHSIHGLNYYQNYFTLPGNELYYKFYWGDVAFFSLNSTETNLSRQKEWLEEEMQKCEKIFKIVYFHHPPYSIGPHGNEPAMQWDFHAMGIDVVLNGHDHLYSRIEKLNEPGLHYIVNGAGGKSLYNCDDNPLDSEDFSVVCYDDNYGAIRGKATNERLILEFFSIDNMDKPVDVLNISGH